MGRGSEGPTRSMLDLGFGTIPPGPTEYITIPSRPACKMKATSHSKKSQDMTPAGAPLPQTAGACVLGSSLRRRYAPLLKLRARLPRRRLSLVGDSVRHPWFSALRSVASLSASPNDEAPSSWDELLAARR